MSRRSIRQPDRPQPAKVTPFAGDNEGCVRKIAAGDFSK
jgi:hypothetical protein